MLRLSSCCGTGAPARILYLAGAILSTAIHAAPGSAARTWYVKADGSGDVPTIQAAVDSAAAGDLVLVAAGTYTWSGQGTGNDYAMIRFLRGTTGFTFKSESGPEATILDAERQGRVLYIQGYNELLIEGFTIARGKAPLYGDYYGGGIIGHLSSPVIRNCIIRDCEAVRGAGMYYAGVSGPRIEGCSFIANRATHGAAAFLINSSSTPVFAGCLFRDNIAEERGGAIYLYHFPVSLERCVFHGNRAGLRGGALYGYLIYPSAVTGCTIAGNWGAEGSALCVTGPSSPLEVRSSIIAFSQDGPPFFVEPSSSVGIGCSDVFGNASGDAFPPGVVDRGDNYSLDPQFCGSDGSGNYFLQSDTPCIPPNNEEHVQCGLVGALDVGCGAVGVNRGSWGKIKSMYRR